MSRNEFRSAMRALVALSIWALVALAIILLGVAAFTLLDHALP